MYLSDDIVGRLKRVMGEPDLGGTRYRLAGELGRGGMGTVYLVRDLKLDREVAMKVLSLDDPQGEIASRLLREARILAKLEHPGIVPVHDVGRLPDGRVFYVMKRVQGTRLDRCRRQASAALDLLRIFQKICEAVAFAHSHGVIHRDLKPENVMVGEFGEVLVLDWGVAKVLGEAAAARADGADAGDKSEKAGETAHGTVVGTPGYMAPEQARGEVDQVGVRSDVYALGAILHFLLAGPADSQPTRPSDAGEEAAFEINHSIPRPLREICRKALAADPGERYADSLELSRDLARYLEGQAVAAYREPWPERLRRVYRRYKTPILLVLTYLVFRVLFLLYTGR